MPILITILQCEQKIYSKKFAGGGKGKRAIFFIQFASFVRHGVEKGGGALKLENKDFPIIAAPTGDFTM